MGADEESNSSDSATTDTDDADTDDSDTDDSDTDDSDTDDTDDSGIDDETDSGEIEEDPKDYEFEELDGIAVVEFEEFYESVTDPKGEDYHTWYVFNPDDEPTVSCTTNVACNEVAPPNCNEYANCDDDSWDFENVSGGYVESLPNRRRNDDERKTGFCVRNDPNDTPVLRYRVNFTNADRYYVWVRCQARGPADNGIHVGIDGTWPENELIDQSGMRLQLPNGEKWTQNRRGNSQHTGVSAGNGVSRRDANVWLEVETPGVHLIQFGMREDGVACDKFVLVS
ncbi:MAG: hypothetical protein AAFV53_37065, partial [Myxococcota bacterium]